MMEDALSFCAVLSWWLAVVAASGCAIWAWLRLHGDDRLRGPLVIFTVTLFLTLSALVVVVRVFQRTPGTCDIHHDFFGSMAGCG